MINQGQKSYKYLIFSILDKMQKLNKSRKYFILETFILFISIKDKINFLQLDNVIY